MSRIAWCAAAIIVAGVAIIAACGGSGSAPLSPVNTSPSAADEQGVDQQVQPGDAPSAADEQGVDQQVQPGDAPSVTVQQEQQPSTASSAGSSHSEPRTISDIADDVCGSEEGQRLEERARAGALMWGELLDYEKNVKDIAEELNNQDWPDALADLWLVRKSMAEETIEIAEDYDRDELVTFTMTLEDAQMISRLVRIWDNVVDSLRRRLPADWEILRDAGCFD